MMCGRLEEAPHFSATVAQTSAAKSSELRLEADVALRNLVSLLLPRDHLTFGIWGFSRDCCPNCRPHGGGPALPVCIGERGKLSPSLGGCVSLGDIMAARPHPMSLGTLPIVTRRLSFKHSNTISRRSCATSCPVVDAWTFAGKCPREDIKLGCVRSPLAPSTGTSRCTAVCCTTDEGLVLRCAFGGRLS